MRKFTKTVISYLEDEIERARLHKSETTVQHHIRALKSFSDYLHCMNRNNIPFRELSPELVAGYQRYLQLKGLCRNSTSYYMRNLRTLFARAIRQGRATDDLFRLAYTGVAATRKRAVQDDIIRRLAQLDIPRALAEHGHHFAHSGAAEYVERLTLARDLFLFSFYTCGMPFVDIVHLTRSNISDNLIRYSRQKTHQQIEVGILPESRALIDKYSNPSRYLFPLLERIKNDGGGASRRYESALRQHNRYLKTLSRLIDSPSLLTSYVSRHTWATSASRHQVNLTVISQALGHNSEQTTRIYLNSLESNQIMDANRHLLDSIFVSL